MSLGALRRGAYGNETAFPITRRYPKLKNRSKGQTPTLRCSNCPRTLACSRLLTRNCWGATNTQMRQMIKLATNLRNSLPEVAACKGCSILALRFARLLHSINQLRRCWRAAVEQSHGRWPAQCSHREPLSLWRLPSPRMLWHIHRAP